MERRNFITAGVALLGGALAAGLGLLGGLFVDATSRWPRRTAKKWVALCKTSDLAEGKPFAASFSFERLEGWYREFVSRQVYVTKGEDGLPRVLSRRCTHLGCQVSWKEQSRTFRCPCHGGIFDPSGKVTEGPPRGPLVVVPCRLAGEVVEVEEA